MPVVERKNQTFKSWINFDLYISLKLLPKHNGCRTGRPLFRTHFIGWQLCFLVETFSKKTPILSIIISIFPKHSCKGNIHQKEIVVDVCSTNNFVEWKNFSHHTCHFHREGKYERRKWTFQISAA